MKISANWLRDFITLAPPLERILDRLTMAGLEVKKIEAVSGSREVIFEIEITSNRPDWLSHFGVAREIAAVENLSLKTPAIEKSAGSRPLPPKWKVDVKDLEACPYYTATYFEGLTPAATPDFMRDRLAACGIRSIDLIVDITNYVLLETGQPLHAFDADLIRDQHLLIRRAKPNENFIAINGVNFTLNNNDLVIADSERVLALAGVMGGKDSEVNPRTRNILLESAFFAPRWVRTTSRRTGLQSDSSYRFERRVDPEGVDFARERATDLIKQYAKPRFISGVLRAGSAPKTFTGRIHLSATEVSNVLGTAIKPHEISSALTRLGFDIKKDPSDSWSVGVPSFRSDVTRPVDLIEEIARIHGYDNIPETLPNMQPLPSAENPRLALEKKSRNVFTGIGFYEAITFSLINGHGLDSESDLGQAVGIVNPMNKDLNWMRPTLLPSLLQVVQKNERAGARGVGIFEIAHRYKTSGKEGGIVEEKVLALAMYKKWKIKNWLDPERDATFYDLKGAISAWLDAVHASGYEIQASQKSFFTSSAEKIMAGNTEIGFYGEVQPKTRKLWDLDESVFYAEISLDLLAKQIQPLEAIQDIPKHPASERDISIVVPEAKSAGEIEQEILKLDRNRWIREVQLFDVFRGGRVPKGCKNLAFRIIYQSSERTLISDEVQALHTDIAAAIAKKFQASFQQ